MVKVSIVIPVYNVEKYLDMCISSVQSQTFTNLEIILVDDGSTDKSPEMCDEYALKDNRIKVIHQKNGGLSNARNTGTKNATGDYVYYLDSDDSIHPEMISKLVELATKNNAALVQVDIEQVPNDFTDFKKDIQGDGRIYKFNTVEAFYNLDRDDKNIADDIRLITFVVWNKLYKKELVDKISFPEDIKLHEDQMVAHRFIVEAGGMIFCREKLYYYRKRPNSLITEGWTVKRLTMIDCYEDRMLWCKKISKEQEGRNELLYYIYVRYLTCIFKNYMMTTKKLQGEERKKYCDKLLAQFKEAQSSHGIKLKMKDNAIFACFKMMPNIFTKIYIGIKG